LKIFVMELDGPQDLVLALQFLEPGYAGKRLAAARGCSPKA
jgi:hypothetical protein